MGIDAKVGAYEESTFTLDSEESKALVRSPDWKAFKTILSSETIQTMQKVDDQPDNSLDELLDTDNSVGVAIVNVLENVEDSKVLLYTLQIIEDALLPNLVGRATKLFAESDADLLSGYTNEDENDTLGPKLNIIPFVRLLTNSDTSVQIKALYQVALLLSISGKYSSQELHVRAILSFALESLIEGKKSNIPSSGIGGVLQATSVILRNSFLREEFNKRGGVVALIEYAEKHFASIGADSQYTLLLCVWSCCFDNYGLQQVDQSTLPVLVNILKQEPAIRIMRVCVAALRLVISDTERQKALCETLIEAKLPKILEGFAQSGRIKDIELNDDISWLRDTLVLNFSVLTTFARHEQELLTKKLKWSMIHEEIFWKENALKFEQNNFSSVRLLLKLLEESTDEQTKAVACSDIGFFVQYFPNGKVIVDSHGGKLLLMKLLSDESPNVQKQALLACSKIMVNNWASVKASS